MGTKFLVRMLAMFVILGLVFGAAQSTWAQGKTQLPQIKTPTSERFDITGKVTITSTSSAPSSNISVNIGGNGSVTGNNMEADITYDLPAAVQGQPGVPSSSSLSVSVKMVDGKAYVKFSGLTSVGIEDKWYVFNAPQGSNAGTLSSGASIVPTDPALAQAYTVTQVGKEDVNGAPTTKYQIDIDVNKLLSAIAAQAGQGATPSVPAAPPPANTDIKEQVFLWVGDNDQYLHKLSESVNVRTTGSSSTQTPDITFTVDVTITFKDFDQPVTITAPPNAEPIDLNSANGSMVQAVAGGFVSNPLSGGIIGLLGMQTASTTTTTTTVVSGPVSTPPVVVGMPTTGSGSSVADELWLPVALSLLCLAVGVLIRRRATGSR